MTDTQTNQTEMLAQARESFSGRILTDGQYDEALSIVDIIKGHIHRTGAFKDKLGDYAYAFARTEKFDPKRADDTIRDLFKEVNGQSMNQLREELMERENSIELDAPTVDLVKETILTIQTMIKEGNKITFNRAYHAAGEDLAQQLEITNAGAKRFMVEVFRQEKDQELYDWGKSLEEKYYRPQIEAEVKERKQSKSSNAPSKAAGRSYSRTASTRTRSAAGPRR